MYTGQSIRWQAAIKKLEGTVGFVQNSWNVEGGLGGPNP